MILTAAYNTGEDSAYIKCIKEINMKELDQKYGDYIEFNDIVTLFSACGPTITRRILREWCVPMVRNPKAPFDKKPHIAVRKHDLIGLILAIKAGKPLYKSNRFY